MASVLISVRRERKTRAGSVHGVAMPREKQNHYRPSDREPFMNERQRDYFRGKLQAWREDILREAQETLQHLQDENQNHPDLADRASSETERAIELRARDRQRKLIAKIDAAPASRSRSGGWKRGRSRPCRSRPRSATSGASASTATIEVLFSLPGREGRCRRRRGGAPPPGSFARAEAASLTPCQSGGPTGSPSPARGCRPPISAWRPAGPDARPRRRPHAALPALRPVFRPRERRAGRRTEPGWAAGFPRAWAAQGSARFELGPAQPAAAMPLRDVAPCR